MSGRAGVEQHLYLLQQAFEGNREHSLLANLRSVADADWDWTPPGGTRTIRALVAHVGECKYVYENHAFGDAIFRWDRAPDSFQALLEGSTGPPDAGQAWLEEGQQRLVQAVAALDDAELQRPRRTNRGARRDALDHRCDDRARPLARGRDQSPARPAAGRRPLGLRGGGADLDATSAFVMLSAAERDALRRG